MRALLRAAGNPQLKYPVIQVAGTSGKGSTAQLIGSLLKARGLKVGLHQTPYLQSPTEKLVLGEKLASAEEFAASTDWLFTTAEKMCERDPGFELRYGSAWVTLTFGHFARAKPDFLVLECGAGARYDLTNVTEPEVSVITRVGLDHQATLGGSVAEIAWHKAGIARAGRPLVTIAQGEQIDAVIDDECARVGARLKRLREGTDWVVNHGGGRTSFTYRGKTLRLGPVELGDGAWQAENAALACGAVEEILAGVSVPDIDAMGRWLARTRLQGRLELVSKRPLVILDGAHNPQKSAALARTLPGIVGRRKLVAVLGVMGYKKAKEVLEPIAAAADEVVFTQADVYVKRAYPARELMELVGVENARAIADPNEALRAAIGMAGPDGAVCVTGSLYLVGRVRERWWPTDRIVSQRTPWPD
ncbi:MAG: Mur ligase family protein [Chloroflexi bacterium]|nr:Mur ligase family protein [Chloroflexota bacterium]